MTELRFHRDLYDGAAIDEAVKVFARFARFELREEAQHWVVNVTSKVQDRERKVAGELGNYALGLVIKQQGGKRADAAVKPAKGAAS